MLQIGDFINHQTLHMGQVTEALQSQWHLKATSVLASILPQPTDSRCTLAMYLASQRLGPDEQQLVAFVKTVSLVMTDQLTSVIYNSASGYARFWQGIVRARHTDAALLMGYPPSIQVRAALHLASQDDTSTLDVHTSTLLLYYHSRAGSRAAAQWANDTNEYTMTSMTALTAAACARDRACSI